MRRTLRRVATIGVAVAAGMIISQASPASAAPRSDAPTIDTIVTADYLIGEGDGEVIIIQPPTLRGVSVLARGLGDAAQGLGGVGIGPLPAPTPGIRPVAIIEWAQSHGSDVAQGLGGVGIGPLPAPTPGIRPVQVLSFITSKFNSRGVSYT